MSKGEDFLKNCGYEVTKSGTNPFNNIEMEGTPRDPEEDNVGEICMNDMEEEDIIYLGDVEEEDYSDEEDAEEENDGDPEDAFGLDFQNVLFYINIFISYDNVTIVNIYFDN